jgi:hypothetical protein
MEPEPPTEHVSITCTLKHDGEGDSCSGRLCRGMVAQVANRV